MKIQVKAEDFARAVCLARKAVPARATLPIITNVLIEAREGEVVVIGTNLETYCVANCKAKVIRAGRAVLDPSVLALPTTGMVEISEIKEPDYNLLVQYGNIKQRLSTDKAENFPPVPAIKKSKPFAITGLVAGLKAVIHAAAPDTTRPILNGVFFNKVSAKRLCLVTADGFRLAVTELAGVLPADFILPLDTTNILLKMGVEDKVKGLVEITPAGELPKAPVVQFIGKGFSLYCQTVPGTFPKYTQLIPDKKGAVRLTVDSAELSKALAGFPNLKNVKILRLISKGKNLIIAGAVSGESEVEATIPLVSGRIMIAISPKLLIEAVKQFSGKMVFETKRESSPMVIRQGYYLEVIMPMFVNWDKSKSPYREIQIQAEPKEAPQEAEATSEQVS